MNYVAWEKCQKCGTSRPDLVSVKITTEVETPSGPVSATQTERRCYECPTFKTTAEGYAFLWFGGAALE